MIFDKLQQSLLFDFIFSTLLNWLCSILLCCTSHITITLVLNRKINLIKQVEHACKMYLNSWLIITRFVHRTSMWVKWRSYKKPIIWRGNSWCSRVTSYNRSWTPCLTNSTKKPKPPKKWMNSTEPSQLYKRTKYW